MRLGHRIRDSSYTEIGRIRQCLSNVEGMMLAAFDRSFCHGSQ